MEVKQLFEGNIMMSHVRRTLSLLIGRSGVCRCSDQPARTSSTSSSGLVTGSDGSGAGLVLRSQSTDVYQNLALEDWIDANVDLQQRSILLLWRNRPAVVIGRHQNPWTECNLQAMRRAEIPLARRRSGGGTVFHDLGNLNLTFFTSKKGYDRQRNLKVITEALRRICPGLDVQATDRFDILLNGHLKISGREGGRASVGQDKRLVQLERSQLQVPESTAAETSNKVLLLFTLLLMFAGTASRLSRKSSYHHCTLLHSADRSALAAVLRPSCPGIISNATPSVPSPVANLLDHAPTLQWEELLDALVHQYNAGTGLDWTSEP